MINQVIDLSHHNDLTNNAFHDFVAQGIVGILHKATQGNTMLDKEYAGREARARSVGLLWGGYHFLTREVPVDEQLQFFLSKVDPATTLLAVDFEKNEQSGTIPTVEQAHAFVQGVFDATGKFPLFYSGSTIKEALGSHADPLLGRCDLWLAQYGPTPTVQNSWADWALWQYTGDGVGDEPHTITGVIGNVERDKFRGSEEELRAWWASHLVSPE